MAKLKLEFTEDMIKLIRNLRFDKIEPQFFVFSRHEDSEVVNLNHGKYNVIKTLRKKNGEFEQEVISPITVELAEDFGDNLYGLNIYSLWGGTYMYEDMALILDKMDKAIEGTSEEPDGVKFDEETTAYFSELSTFIIEHLKDIEEILHQFCTEGIQAGVVYSCKPNEHLWTKE